MCVLFDFNIYEASLLLSRVFQSGVYDLEVGVQQIKPYTDIGVTEGTMQIAVTCGFI